MAVAEGNDTMLERQNGLPAYSETSNRGNLMLFNSVETVYLVELSIILIMQSSL